MTMKFFAKFKNKLPKLSKSKTSSSTSATTGLREEMVNMEIPSTVETTKDQQQEQQLHQHSSKYLHQESIAPFSSPNEQKSSIFGTSSNLVNTIVGAGIIGIPYAMLQCGLLAGTALLILVGILTEKSLRMLIDASGK